MKLINYEGDHHYSFKGKNIVHKTFPHIPRKVLNNELAKSQVYSKFKPYKKKKTSPIYIHKKRELFQADLAFLNKPELIAANEGNQYLLVIIDCFTKKIWLYPLLNKQSKSVYEKFKHLFQTLKVLPKKLQTDKGTEFLGSQLGALFKQHNVYHYVTNTDRKAAIAERVILTIKRTLKKKMLADKENPNNWIDKLDNVRNNYLKTWHSTIKMTPEQAELKENEFLVRLQFYRKNSKQKIEKKPKYKIGDIVRLYGLRNLFKRGDEQNYTNEYFIIYKIKKSPPLPTSRYYVKDINGNKFKNDPPFFENELSLFIPTPDTSYIIDEITGQKVINGVTYYLVRWKGWPKNSLNWVRKDKISNNNVLHKDINSKINVY